MREAAGRIQTEVGLLTEDVRRMSERVAKLGQHFGQANEDVRQILISTQKIEQRGARIHDVEFADDDDRRRRHHPRPDDAEAGEPGSDRSAASHRASLGETLAVYLKRRVLIVMFLGFSSGLPLALSGSTLLVWMTEAKVNLGTIGLFALVGTPYTIKFLWAPLIDALDVPLLSHQLGRRRGWLIAVAGVVDRGDRVSGLVRSRGVARDRRGRRAHGRRRVGDAGHRRRCLPGRKPRRERAGRRHGVLCRRLPHRHVGLDCRRAVPGQRLRRVFRPRPPRRLERRLCRHGGAGRHRHRNDADRRPSRKSRAAADAVHVA